jgi:5'-3' exoribonuclease 2
MGVPAFFREIIKKYPSAQFWNPNMTVHHLCIDFNSFIYNAFNSSSFRDRMSANSSLTVTKLENALIKDILSNLRHFVNNVVKPKKSIYIAIDGSAPRAKMIQQRNRRFKGGIIEKRLKEQIDAKYGVELTDNHKILSGWNASQNASPGTKFMMKLSAEIRKGIKADMFVKSDGVNQLVVAFSDTSIPGEGEHKYLPFIKSLEKSADDRDDSVVVYSPDADVIMLNLLQTKNNLYVMQKVTGDQIRMSPQLEGMDYVYISADLVKQGIFEKVMDIIPMHVRNQLPDKLKNRDLITVDYLFLLFLAGNDFITPIPFLKIGQGGLDTIQSIYARIFTNIREYLISFTDSGKPRINTRFFMDIMNEVSRIEDSESKKYYRNLNFKRKNMSVRNDQDNPDLTPAQREWNMYQHKFFYEPIHPEFAKYNRMFDIINYNESPHIWRQQYYHYHFHLDPANVAEYNARRTQICRDFIRTLHFNLQYYLTGCPSWTWYYPYHTAPVPSDLAQTLSQMADVNEPGLSEFEPTTPFKPFDQLMMILPTSAADILPKSYQKLLEDPNSPLIPYYPEDFELDIVTGGKYVYSEAILPSLPAELVLAETAKLEKKLTAVDKKRNEIRSEPDVFIV